MAIAELPVEPRAPSIPAAKQRIDNLDLVRATAIVMVVMFHLPSFAPWPDGPALRIVQGWWSGVDLFFVLSGYLVGGLFWSELARQGKVKISLFILRRALRTVPPYLVALHLIYIFRWVSGAPVGYDWTYWVFLQNYTGMPLFSVSWSLCIEEHFYLIAPFVLAVVAWAGRPWMILLLLPLSLIFRLLYVEPGSGAFGPHFYASHNHFEGLVLGIWLAYARMIYAERWDSLAGRLGPIFVLCLVFVFGYKLFRISHYTENTMSYTWLALAYGFILFILVSQPGLAIAKTQGTKLLAREAFSLYLTHTYVLLIFQQFLVPRLAPVPWPALVVLALAMVVIGGHFFYLLVERPTLIIRDHLLSRLN